MIILLNLLEILLNQPEILMGLLGPDHCKLIPISLVILGYGLPNLPKGRSHHIVLIVRQPI